MRSITELRNDIGEHWRLYGGQLDHSSSQSMFDNAQNNLGFQRKHG